MNQMPRKKRLGIYVAILIALLVLGFYAIPIIKGKYRLNKFVESLAIGMERGEVYKIAQDIGYLRHDREIVGKGIIKSTKSHEDGQTVDVFYFKNLMMDSAVAVYYDKSEKVIQISSD